MYWRASVSTWSSMSKPCKSARTVIFLVITADEGSARATFLVLIRFLASNARRALATSSIFSMPASPMQPAASGALARDSSTGFWAVPPKPTALMPQELRSIPSISSGPRLNKDFKSINYRPKCRDFGSFSAMITNSTIKFSN